MKNNMKGFTLVELLAVIVILAIIALVTTPVILGVIENSRKDAAADKAWGTIEAVKLAYTQAQMKSEFVSTSNSVDFSKSSDQWTIGGTDVKVSISGDQPTEGTVTIDTSTGNGTCSGLKFGDYKCSNTTDANKMVCEK